MPRLHPLALLISLTSAALAAQSSTTIPLNVTTSSSCVFDQANSAPTIDLYPEYKAGSVTSGPQGQVSVSVYCNKNTPISQRTLIGTTSTSTPGAHVTAVLTQFSPGTTDQLNVEAWFVTGPNSPVINGTYRGATRSVTLVNAGWPSAPQFNASSGFYTGSVSLVISF
ncbi:hypothetical protein EHF33_14625 [Deinococcus psychrotolerans]|uniref:Spore coat protein U domain-containing protein n=1 Tax=Deinococcus psychrotolerans TaxID=2489213 RepID=A0A3G8YIP3_9DEIO|nr:hypothetical protein [Deinococcus psychrotolerans]AZI44137.1 hypothetical protein EHF33_14625 [Deinococcus psychrotolerans]